MNNFYHHLGKEDNLTMAVLQLIALKYRQVFVWHTPNEGRRSAFERFKAKALGIVSGVSDLILVCNGKLLALELKIGNNKMTLNQKNFQDAILKNGFWVSVAYNVEQADFIISGWLESNAPERL
jgi:hypothetical protein